MTQLADRDDVSLDKSADATAPTDASPALTKTVVVDRTPPAPNAAPVRPRAVSAKTADDWLALVGSGVASLCLSWLLYEVVLPLSGTVGFFLFWFAMFVGLYALVTSLTQPFPIVLDRMVSSAVTAGATVVFGALAWTIIYTFYRGWHAYSHWNFYTQDMSNAGPLAPFTKGGISHALLGTVEELGIAVVISLPLGVATAVFMCEVGGKFAKIVRTVVEAMTALPDLIAGLFVYTFLIIELGQDRTGFAAAVALSITMLPIIARSSEVVLRVVPGGLREASLALGAPLWRTVWNVVLPTAKSGLATALILGMARGIGETAPLLIVTRETTYLEKNPFHNPMESLPLYAYTHLRAPDTASNIRGYGAASVLLVVVVILFLTVRLLARQRGGKR